VSLLLMKFLAIILLSLGLVLEASLTTIPFVFLILLCLMVILRENWLFAVAFVFGLLFDLLSFKTLWHKRFSGVVPFPGAFVSKQIRNHYRYFVLIASFVVASCSSGCKVIHTGLSFKRS